MSFDGLLNLKKPAGMTSRQAVDVIWRLTRPARAGHAGTLDPLATGVLIVCVGAARRLIEYVQRMPKRYTGTFRLGCHSPTEDLEGELTLLPDAPAPTLAQITAAAARLVGRIEQRPPVFSAIKIQGQPAYKLARQGERVELAAREIEIHRIEVLRYEYPELTLDINCGSGTYIRSLGRDLAESVGTAAVMSALTRTAIGPFSIDAAVDPRELTPDNLAHFLHPPLVALESLPRVQLSADETRRIRQGQMLTGKGEVGWEGENGQLAASRELSEIVAVDSAGELIGILALDAAGRLRTVRNMPTGS